jgi:hypothetical protein
MDVAGLAFALPAVIFKICQIIGQIKGAPTSIIALQAKLQALSDILQLLRARFDQNQPPAILGTVEGELNGCLEKLQSLEIKVSGGWRGKIRGQIGRLRWPLNEDEMEKIATSVSNLTTVLGMGIVAMEAERQEQERRAAGEGRLLVQEVAQRQLLEISESDKDRLAARNERVEAFNERKLQEAERRNFNADRRRDLARQKGSFSNHRRA